MPAQSRRFSSSDAADASERLTGRRSHMDEAVRLIVGQRLEGPAITMRVVRDDRASSRGEGLKVINVFEQAPKGSVIVVCLDGDPNYAVLGATFATLSKSRQISGIVTNGAMRGLSDLRRIGVPIFSRGTVAGSAGGHYRLESVGQTVSCGGAQVSQGDLIVGDADGIAVVGRDSVASVRALAQRLRDEKEKTLPLIAKHRSYTKAIEELSRKPEP